MKLIVSGIIIGFCLGFMIGGFVSGYCENGIVALDLWGGLNFGVYGATGFGLLGGVASIC